MNTKKLRLLPLQIFSVLILASPLAPADSMTFPLQGYFHPGRAMPVEWHISPDNSRSRSLTLSADNAATSRIDRIEPPRGIIPWLIYDSLPRNPRCQVSGGPDLPLPALHALDPSDRLVATFAKDDSLANALFPDHRIIVIPLDSQFPLAGSSTAWETLDAIIFTPDSLKAISHSTLKSLYIAGILLAVQGDWPTENTLPHTRAGSLSIASLGISLPPLITADVDRPTAGWVAGRSWAFRRRILLLGLTFCLLVAGLSLWRSRWMPVAIVCLCGGSFAFFNYDNRYQSPIAIARGIIRVDRLPTSFADEWIFQSSHRQTDFQTPYSDSFHPVFASAAQRDATHLSFQFDPDGLPMNISGTLFPDRPLAFMVRELEPPPNASPVKTQMDSPLRWLVIPTIYPGLSVSEQRPDQTPAGGWETIVLRAIQP